MGLGREPGPHDLHDTEAQGAVFGEILELLKQTAPSSQFPLPQAGLQQSGRPLGQVFLRSVTSIEGLHVTPSRLDSWCAT